MDDDRKPDSTPDRRRSGERRQTIDLTRAEAGEPERRWVLGLERRAEPADDRPTSTDDPPADDRPTSSDERPTDERPTEEPRAEEPPAR